MSNLLWSLYTVFVLLLCNILVFLKLLGFLANCKMVLISSGAILFLTFLVATIQRFFDEWSLIYLLLATHYNFGLESHYKSV